MGEGGLYSFLLFEQIPCQYFFPPLSPAFRVGAGPSSGSSRLLEGMPAPSERSSIFQGRAEGQVLPPSGRPPETRAATPTACCLWMLLFNFHSVWLWKMLCVIHRKWEFVSCTLNFFLFSKTSSKSLHLFFWILEFHLLFYTAGSY